MKYTKVVDGEWVEPLRGHRMACCDCGLVHRMKFRVVNGRVQFAATRDKKETSKLRSETKAAPHDERGETDDTPWRLDLMSGRDYRILNKDKTPIAEWLDRDVAVRIINAINSVAERSAAK